MKKERSNINSKSFLVKKRIKTKKGLSLLEAMLAVFIFSLMVTTFSGAIIYGQESTLLSGARTQAVLLAEEGLEAARNIRDEDYANLANGTFGLAVNSNQWEFSGTSDTNGIYTRTIDISDSAANTKSVTSTVTWQQNLQRTGTINLTTYLTNWRANRNFLNCDWSSVQVRDTFNSVGNTNNALKVYARGTDVFMVYQDIGGASFDFAIVDVSSTPVLLGSLNMIGEPSNVYVSGDYAYVTSDDNNSELQIVDISNLSSPIARGVFDAGGRFDANGVYVSGSYAYVVRDGGNGDEFVIVDITDPDNPSLSGSVDLGGSGNGGEEVYVSENYAYVASPDNSKELKIIDISSKSSPVHLSSGGYDSSGNNDANTITGFGSTVIIGLANGDINFLNVSNPLSVSLISNYVASDAVNDIALGDDNLVILEGSSSNVNDEFESIDISDISSPFTLGTLDWGAPFYGVAFAGDQCIAYAVGGSNASNPELFVIEPGVDTVPPAAVTDLAASNPSSASIDLSWTAPGDDGSIGQAASYDVRYSTSAITEANWASATPATGEPSPSPAGTAESMTVGELSPGQTYFFAIKASDEIPNVSAISNSPSDTTLDPDVTPPAAVTDLATSGPTANSINLSWTAPGDDGNTGTATTYDVRYSTSAITEANWASATPATGEPSPSPAGTAESMTVGGLSSNQTYFFAIKTSDEVPNTSAISNSPSGTTLDAIPPAAVTDLATSGPTANSINLSWTAPGDDGNTGTATTYDVRYSTSAITEANWASATPATGEPSPSPAGTAESMTVGGLSSNQTYFFAIKTSDEVPNTSAISNSPSGTTLGFQADYLQVDVAGVGVNPGDNTQVTGITLENIGSSDITITQITVDWSGVPGNRKINNIDIGGTNVWTGNERGGTLLDITDYILTTGSGALSLLLDFDNSITGITLSIQFNMSDGSSKTISGITP